MEINRKLSPSQEVGDEHETRALEYFEAKKWKLICRNYRCKAGEIDLIFWDREGSVVFVEVKYRSSADYGFAEEFVDWNKQRKLGRAALLFVKEQRLYHQNLRFDIAAVSPGEILHIPNAFSPEGYTI